ncbi:MAG: SDR family oxidoreductase [Bryobacteraceae bacterium]|nr:SDR family oxidoreductase [Bryobacteraceae bacterium]
MNGLEGKTALVTGASRGIGQATAIALAKAGVARVFVHYGGHRAGADETVAAVREAGAEAEAIRGELSNDAGIAAFCEAIAGREIDVLVNNAGSLVKRAKLLESTPELFDEVYNLNVKSAWFVAKAVAGGMIERKAGAIVNLSSVAARHGGGPGAAIYSSAKAAVSCFTRGLAKELAPHGIRVNAVSPGTVDNHFHEVFSTQQMLDSMKSQTPAGKLGSNEEIADTIVFLCSDGGRFIHGQTIEVNGGLYMV